jgi:hypothetical protein
MKCKNFPAPMRAFCWKKTELIWSQWDEAISLSKRDIAERSKLFNKQELR